MHRKIWNGLAVVFSAIGWIAAFLELPASVVAAIAATAATVAVAVTGSVSDFRSPTGHAPATRYLRLASRAAIGVVAGVGFVVVAGFDGVALVALFVVSAPPVAHRIQDRWADSPSGQSSATAPPSRHGALPAPAQAVEWPAPDSLTTAQLCLAWRASYTALQRSRTSADFDLLVQLRAGYLDALQERDPENFTRWLASGARAASDPARYLSDPSFTDAMPDNEDR